MYWIRIRWTGMGWLSPVFFAATMVAVGMTAVAFDGVGGPAPVVGPVFTFVAGGVLHRLMARHLNSAKTPDGRRYWHDEHTFNDVPIQRVTGLWLVLTLIVVAIVLGRSTSPILGWVSFGAGLLAIPVVGSSLRAQQRLAALGTEREALADRWGWRYLPKAPNLPQRWRALVGWRTFSMVPQGVIGGEIDGMPFTVFDSEVGLGGRAVDEPHTIWVVHLPVAFPRIVVTASVHASLVEAMVDDRAPLHEALLKQNVTAGDVEAETEMPAFGQALLSPEVREATIGLRLDWRIEGRDLIVSLGSNPPPSADEIVGVARRLVALAQLIPATAVSRYGRDPTTDIPLPAARG